MDIDQLIVNAQSAENDVRNAAEQQLLEACDADAAQVFGALIAVADDKSNSQPLSSRLFALLTLRKLITMHWSPGFSSYRGTSNLREDVKDTVRSSLLSLCLGLQQDTKIKNSASYCVVQISAVDFPDQWPQLLNVIYDSIINSHSLEAMSLLNEIYDDVVSAEMFFEGNVGKETIDIVFQLLLTTSSTIEAKLAASKLFHACLLQMSTLDDSFSSKRKILVNDTLGHGLELFKQLLISNLIENAENPDMLTFKGGLYEDLAYIRTTFPRRHFPAAEVAGFKSLAISDLHSLASLYGHMLQEDKNDAGSIKEAAIHLIEFLAAIDKTTFAQQELNGILESLVTLCSLENSVVEDWNADINIFVSKETGLFPSYDIRDQAADYLMNIQESHFSTMLVSLLNIISTVFQQPYWKSQESALFIMQAILANDADIPESIKARTDDVQSLLSMLLNNENFDVTVYGRCVILVPKILEKFMDILPDIKILTQRMLKSAIDNAIASPSIFFRVCALFGFTYYCSYAELASVLEEPACLEMQKNVLGLVTEVAEEAEEDTSGFLMEVIENVVSCSSNSVESNEIRESEFNLVLTLSSKDPANIQVLTAAEACLDKILDGLSTERYLKFVKKCFPSFIKLFEEYRHTNYQYSPLLSLTLEFITIFMKKRPMDAFLPSLICQSLFEPLFFILSSADEDETLQLATEAFTYMVHNTEPVIMRPYLENIVKLLDRLLSINVSDTAAMNVGSLILTLFTNFPQEIQPLAPQILQAAAIRLVNSKNISTTQNLISVFSFLVGHDAAQTVQFLSTLQLPDQSQSILAAVIRKWLDSFEIIRGDRRIKESVLAISKLYLLENSEPFSDITLDGDIIPYDGDKIITRSMAKMMPDRYTQVSVYEKIVKLFIAELASRSKEPTVSKLELEQYQNADADDEAGDWEDVDDVLDYDKLHEYVADEEEDLDEAQDGTQDEITGLQEEIPQDVTTLIVAFFKEAASRNLHNFQHIYNQLNEDEKRILSSNLV